MVMSYRRGDHSRVGSGTDPRHGRDDLEVGIISCLMTAVAGYSSLIFEMEKDIGWDGLLKLCDKLWIALKECSKLPEKLVR